MELQNNVIVVGDTHGEFGNLHELKITESNTDYVFAGDCGCFFKEIKMNRIFKQHNKKLKELNSRFILIRGNHDNPEIFKNPQDYFDKFSNIIFIPNYDYCNYKNKKLLLIGGSFSIDRYYRKINTSIFLDEEPIFPKETPKVDLIISHYVPEYMGIMNYISGKQNDVWDILDDVWYKKNDLDEYYRKNNIIERMESGFKSIISPNTNIISGHYHKSLEWKYNDNKIVTLDCFEMYNLNNIF